MPAAWEIENRNGGIRNLSMALSSLFVVTNSVRLRCYQTHSPHSVGTTG